MCKRSRTWLFLLTFAKTFRNATLTNKLPLAINTKNGKEQLKIFLCRALLNGRHENLKYKPELYLILKNWKKRVLRIAKETQTVPWFQCPNLFSVIPVSLTEQNCLQLLVAFSLLHWAFSQQRGDTSWGLFLLSYLAQNPLWDEETASRCVSVALHPNGIAASWKRLKPSWNCCKVGLGWKLSQLWALELLLAFVPLAEVGETPSQAFSWSWEVRNFLCLVFWNACSFLGW